MTISFNQATRLFVLMLCLSVITSSLYASAITPDKTFDKSLIKPRVENLDFFVRTKYTADTERLIRGFVVLARNNSKRILGQSTIYFPTIEKKIDELGLPDGLKYLPVVESMLNPKAESYAGAKGMWQLMPFIAEEYGIKMDDFVDERFNVEKSTHAGLSYLKDLYERFDNWELALAAYNCGAGRVNRELRRSGKKTFWGIRHLLPKQTREFVPKLIAVKYVFDYYQHHGIEPDFPEIDLQLTQSIEINAGKTYNYLGEISEINGGVISFLNPGYIYEPSFSDLGKIQLVVPARVANAVVRHLKEVDKFKNLQYRTDMTTKSNPYYKVVYAVPGAMTLDQFCQENGLSTSQIWLWNKLYDHNLSAGQEIFAYDYKDLTLEYRLNPSSKLDVEISRLSFPVSLSATQTTRTDRGTGHLTFIATPMVAVLPED